MKLGTTFRWLILSLITVLTLIISGCGKHENNKDRVLKVGVIAGPEAELMQTALDQAKKEFGLKTKLIQFQDYITPNVALADGSIDVNAYQHKLYLDDMNHARGFDLVPVGRMFLYPLGAYSKKITHINQLKPGDKIAVPNDPSNESRALNILAKAGLIKLRDPKSHTSTPADIIDNPQQLKFIELDAAQLPRSLDDVTLAVINSTFAVAAGFLPKKNALLLEDSNSPYVNLIVARKDDKNDLRIKELVKAYHNKIVLEKAQELFKGGEVPGWKTETK